MYLLNVLISLSPPLSPTHVHTHTLTHTHTLSLSLSLSTFHSGQVSDSEVDEAERQDGVAMDMRLIAQKIDVKSRINAAAHPNAQQNKKIRNKSKRNSIAADLNKYRDAKREEKEFLKRKQSSIDTAMREDQVMTYLPRGGSYVKTSAGPIQIGMPPESIKDTMLMGLPTPVIYVFPSKRYICVCVCV
jgi:hypothetical protein